MPTATMTEKPLVVGLNDDTTSFDKRKAGSASTVLSLGSLHIIRPAKKKDGQSGGTQHDPELVSMLLSLVLSRKGKSIDDDDAKRTVKTSDIRDCLAHLILVGYTNKFPGKLEKNGWDHVKQDIMRDLSRARQKAKAV